jgi:hypothetical protein
VPVIVTALGVRFGAAPMLFACAVASVSCANGLHALSTASAAPNIIVIAAYVVRTDILLGINPIAQPAWMQ